MIMMVMMMMIIIIIIKSKSVFSLSNCMFCSTVAQQCQMVDRGLLTGLRWSLQQRSENKVEVFSTPFVHRDRAYDNVPRKQKDALEIRCPRNILDTRCSDCVAMTKKSLK